MEKISISTNRAPGAIGPYSQATCGNGILCVSGQLPINPRTGLIPDTIEMQVEQAMENLIAIIEDSGSDRSKILKCCLFVRDLNQFSRINEVYGRFFKADPPARVVVEVSKLPKDAQIEIDAIAVV